MKIDGVEEALQRNREEITGEVHSAVDASQEEILNRLQYLLDQSTDHRQGVERDLKTARSETDQLYVALQHYAANNDGNMTRFIKRTNDQMQLIMNMVTAATAVGFVVLAIVGVLLIKVI